MKFADTSFLIALLNPKDQWHQTAIATADSLNERVLTTMWVLVELGNALSLGHNRGLYLRFIDQLSGHSQWEVIPASPEWFRRGIDLFRTRPDKEWSLTDCISFLAMQDRDLTEVLTHDHHFEQAGFTVLLRR
jgi:predicted nucleic acid-binding protein